MTEAAELRQRDLPEPAHPVLNVRDLHAEFDGPGGAVTAVGGVSLCVGQGERIAIVGESGCGKSTLALAILGLLDPPGRITEGEVWLNGREISSLNDREMSRIRGKEISLIFQDAMSALDPVKTVGAQIIDTIRRHQPELSQRMARRRAVELLVEVDVPAAARRLDDLPHHYSGGMRQRVMIAIAIANDPDLVIADEPTSALDVTTQAQVLELLDRLAAERGAAIVLITHNLGVVAEFCDTVQVMYSGRFVESAPVDHIFESPLHPYTEALINSMPRPDRLAEDRLPFIPGFPPDLSQLPPGCSFEPRCSYGHGEKTCIERAPHPESLEIGAHSVMVECHFANDRRQRRDGFNRSG
ncbi:MAG: ABC transporter ATP-binding protein [Proteobacteria bacterium]|nr:ABC transporter ATP-binding protein [Pseudomonadota bacterium]